MGASQPSQASSSEIDVRKAAEGGAATLTVFFEGTANRIDYNGTQIGIFFEITDAIDIRLYPDRLSDSHQYKMGFDGCGVTNGSMGVIFAMGLDEQCRGVITHINRLENFYQRISLNVVGLSRGGIAAIYLAQMVGSYSAQVLNVNLLLFDPVPGNLITTSRLLSIFGISTANAAMDLRQCQNLGKVLAVYPYLPLPDLAFHAPVFPMYRDDACVEEDAVLGCHQGALFCQKSRECVLSFVRIKHWLLDCGTALKLNDIAQRLDKSLLECKEEMDKELRLVGAPSMVRYGHSSPSGKVVMRHIGGSAMYLNKWHESLTAELVRQGADISRPASIPASEEGSTHLYLLSIQHSN